MDAALIALDWGTSRLRASLLGDGGQVLEARSAPGGVMAVKDGQFAAALIALCGDWLARHDCPLVASGMVGSRQGWREAPYLPCPATLALAVNCMTTIDIASPGQLAARRLHIAPGLRCLDEAGEFYVMRGEETQIWGAGLAAEGCCVLPGTHSKWAWVDGSGAISRFATYMTGEFYGLLTQHGILGRLMQFDDAPGTLRQDEFSRGVKLGLAQHGQLSHTVFAARTAGLMGTVAPAALPDFLSGILIGAEIGAATQAGVPPAPVTLIGDDALCRRYETALRLCGLASVRAPEGSTTRGQWLLARAAGLIGPA
jgi:2-dehydro-3-deoxygalactonokinase